jgi:UPF0755 protein
MLMTRPVRIIFGVMLVILAIAAVAGGGWLYVEQSFEREGPSSDEIVLAFEPGEGLGSIAEKLEGAGLIDSVTVFRAGVQLKGAQAELKAGEYLFPAHVSMNRIVDILREGKTLQHSITVPEGLTSQGVVNLLKANPILGGDIATIPEEGSLLPDTYLVTRHTRRQKLILRMQHAQQRLLNELWPKRAANLPIATSQEAIILASIVEKETGIEAERPRVAAVFVNRLRRSMRLQSDPTIIYGITKGSGPLRRGIRRSEIAAVTPYNTYQIEGLPPTPIANPGRAAIEAVLNPPDTEELFFVADGTGGHVFAETAAEHGRNVLRWRQIERNRK